MYTGITLTPKSGKTETRIFKLVVEADENDADYIYNTTCIEEDEILNWLPTISLLGNEVCVWGDRRNDSYYNQSFNPTKEQEDMLCDLIPHAEYGVSSVYINSFEYIDENGTIFDVTWDMAKIRNAYPEKFL